MEQLTRLKELFEPVLSANDVVLYDLLFRYEKNMKILQVSIMKNDGSMDLDTCALISEKLSEVLDEHDIIDSEYYLEVCSPGAEREIKDLNELPNIVGKHIFVRLRHSIKSKVEFQGDLLSVNGELVEMNYRDKALTKVVSFDKSEIEFIRLAVKI